MAATTRQSIGDAVYRVKLYISAAGMGTWLGMCGGAALAAHMAGGIRTWWGIQEWLRFVGVLLETGHGYFLWGGAAAGAFLLLLPTWALLRPRKSRPTTSPANGRGPVNPL
jgi:hypothetical protein